MDEIEPHLPFILLNLATHRKNVSVLWRYVEICGDMWRYVEICGDRDFVMDIF
jgi:hypothetical protein